MYLGSGPGIYYSTQTFQNSNQDFSNVNQNVHLKIEIKNELSLKTPNLQGFCLTPNSDKVRSVRSHPLNSLEGVSVAWLLAGTLLDRINFFAHHTHNDIFHPGHEHYLHGYF